MQTSDDRPTSPVTDTDYTADMKLMLENSRRFYAALYWKRRIHIGCQDMLVAAIPPSARFGAANVAMLGAAMTHADIVAAIKDQNTGRSCDPHGIVSEVHRSCLDAWARLMVMVFAKRPGFGF